MTITDDAIQQTIAQFGPVIKNLARAILAEREARLVAEKERDEARAQLAAISEAFDGGETPIDQLPYAIGKAHDVEAARWTKMRDERDEARTQLAAIRAALAPVLEAEERWLAGDLTDMGFMLAARNILPELRRILNPETKE